MGDPDDMKAIADRLKKSLENIEAMALLEEGGLAAVRAAKLRKQGRPKLRVVKDEDSP